MLLILIYCSDGWRETEWYRRECPDQAGVNEVIAEWPIGMPLHQGYKISRHETRALRVTVLADHGEPTS